MADVEVPAVAYLVKGDDESLRSQAVNTLVHCLVGDDQLAVEEMTAEEHGAGPILDACQTPAFLSERRVVLVREAGKIAAADAPQIVDYLSDPNPTTVLVLVAGGGATPRAIDAAIKKVGTVMDTSVGTGRARGQWVTEHLKAAPVKLDPAAMSLLGDHLGEDLGRLSGLLETLEAAFGHGARVGVDELRPFLGEAGGTAPWDLTDAIDKGDVAGALEHLHRQLAGGERHPLVVLATLHRHFSAMLRLDGSNVADEGGAAALLGMAPFPAKKALSQARRLGSASIFRAITLLAEADVDLRGKRGWPDVLVLEVLVARLARLTPRRAAAPAGRR